MTNTIGTPLLWGVFFAAILVMLAVDLFLQGRRGSTVLSSRQAGIWTLIWISVSLLFAAVLWVSLHASAGRETANIQTMAFLTGYVLEKALSIDNVFVWLMLFNYFTVPAIYQRRVLIYGVLGAIVLRAIMIFSGSWLISEFSWILYIFGAFLLFTGMKMAFSGKEKDDEIGNKPLVKWLRKNLKMTENFHGERFFVRQKGALFATPLLLVLIMVELSDVIFAVDSIPAIFAVTTDPFIVLTSNLFAILGLRAMYFLLANMVERFTMLKYGLAIVLIFIGIKMLIVDFYHVPVSASLIIVLSILSATLLINAWIDRKKNTINRL